MSTIHNLTQIMARHFAADQALIDAISLEKTSEESNTTELSGQIELRVKNAQSLTSQVQNRKVAVAPYDLPAPSTAARGERFAASDAARDRLNAARDAITRVEERIENDLQAIDGLRKPRSQALRRLQVMVASAVVLAVVFVGIMLDRFSKAQATFDWAVADLSGGGDLNAFDQMISNADSLVPGYRAAEAAAIRRDAQAHEAHFQVAVAALQRGELAAFEKEMTSLKTLNSAYWQAQVDSLLSLQRSGLDLRKFTIGKRTLALQAPIILDFVSVSGGSFTMGSNPQADRSANNNEQPQHEVTLNDYWIGRTEITNDQYAVYAKAKALGFSVPVGKGDQPVVNVTWDDAQGFVTWLSEQAGLSVRLPSEEEWEKGCRGSYAQIYPWGDNFDKWLLNSGEGGLGATTDVGSYSPSGDSPYGAADMAGNVAEWTGSNFTSDYRTTSQPDSRLRVVRGGGFSDYQARFRCARRSGDAPNNRYANLGFRVVLSPSY